MTCGCCGREEQLELHPIQVIGTILMGLIAAALCWVRRG